MKVQKYPATIYMVLLGAVLVMAFRLVADAQVIHENAPTPSGSQTPQNDVQRQTRIDQLQRKVEQEQLQVASSIASLPIAKCQLFLYSLTPSDRKADTVNTEQVFHGFTILGKIKIKVEQDKRQLITSLTKGIRENKGVVAACFDPHHGIRLVDGLFIYDFVICFECQSVATYGFNKDKGFLVSSTPDKVFNEVIDKYHLKKTE